MADNLIGFEHGKTFSLTGYLVYPDDYFNVSLRGQPVDITGWTITATLVPPRSNSTTRRIITLTPTIVDAAGGVYTLDTPDIATTQWLRNTKYNLKLSITRVSDNYDFPIPTVIIDVREFL